MTRVTVEPEDAQQRTAHARDWLAGAAPELSARTLLSGSQRATLLLVAGLVLVGLVLAPLTTGIVLVALATALYVGSVIYRITITTRSLRNPNVVVVSDDDARAVPDHELPVYTVLVPIYGEAAVLPELVGHLRALEYPKDLLDVQLLVEAGDVETVDAALTHAGDDLHVVVVPESTPRTKPKALNFGLTLTEGELVTIYDAEDRPEPLQLRRAVVAFSRLPADVGCLQAQLAYWNTDQNLLTRWFSIEYLQWFQLLLPGLAASDAPVPLGGTSNHIRTELLEDIGGWDPYNVTEDADLGVRLHRAGYRSAVLASTTLEEANSDYVNWNNQRSRWYKGYIQTWLVHMRHPARLVDELGWRGFAEFNAFVGGTPWLALMNLAFWALTLAWFVGHFAFIKDLFPTAIYYPALLCFVFGNVIIWYQYLLAARLSGRPSLVWAALGVPIYWLMMSIAAVKAVWQVATARSFWEKTVHGLDPARASRSAEAPAPTDGDTSKPRDAVSALPFVAPAEPPLAARIEHSATRAPVYWPARIAGALRLAGFALMAFVVYVIVFSGVGPTPSTTLAHLSIPSVGIFEPISEGTGVTALRHGLGHLSGTAAPGATGEAVLIGHRIASGAHLRELANVRPGDDVFLRAGNGSAGYRVTSVTTRSRSDINPAASGPSQLMLVTGASGLDPDRLLVVEARLATRDTIHVGHPATVAGRPRIPGADGGKFVMALACIGLVVLALRLRRHVPRAAPRHWATLAVGAAAALALFAFFVAAAQALPPTF